MVNSTEGIKYYGDNDLSVGHFLLLSESVLNSFDPTNEIEDINKVIELYNIKRLIDSGNTLFSWDQKTVFSYRNTVKLIEPIIGRYFSQINSNNIRALFNSLRTLYEEDFWSLLSRYKVFNHIDDDIIIDLLNQGGSLHIILSNRDLVKRYDNTLADYMRYDELTADLLITHFLSKTEGRINLPKSLLPSEFETIFERYINSDHPNPNYLRLLYQSQSTTECPISTRLRQKAKHRYQDEINKLFSNRANSGLMIGAEVLFEDSEPYMSFKKTNTLTPTITYSKSWIEENLDYPTLLNNFIYLFGFTDLSFRAELVSKQSELTLTERYLGVKGKKDYLVGTCFRFRDLLSLCQISGYRAILEKNHVNLEYLFHWFFEEYLLDEFGAKGFHFNVSSDGTTYLEKLRNMATEMDSVLKQYSLFILDGCIDQELLEMSSEQVVFSELRSFQKNKYAYASSDTLRNEMYILFSDQSHLVTAKNMSSSFHSFYQLMCSENLTINDFEQYQFSEIKFLIDRGSVIIDLNQVLQFNQPRVRILKDLYDNEVICPNYYEDLQSEIELLINVGDLEYGSTLFSIPEQHYLNYVLNKKEYSNGLDLRNKYIHGSNTQEKALHENDYNRLACIMALIVIKINEEFCLKYPVNN